MKKKVLLILVLMSLCVTGIIGLQLFWNYQNYQTTVRTFDHDINEALDKAVSQETDQRRDAIVKRFQGWLADTSLVTITADHKNRDSSTVFYTQDTHPKFAEDKKRKAQFGLADFKEKLDHITPEAKTFMIEHFGERILKRDLKDGVVYHYTQLLGDSLEKVFNSSKADTGSLRQLFKKALAAKNIRSDFSLNPARKGTYLTRPVNTNFRQPFKNDFVRAGFESPGSYFLREMRWVIITSLLLIIITIGCFTYTVKTLLSQQKLAELKDDFVNNMTHELNTPISSIKITAEALKGFRQEPERQAEYLDIISYQADKLSELTGQILQTRKTLSSGAKNSPVELNQLIQMVLNDLKPQINSKAAVVSFEPTTNITVKGDLSALRNALVNLIDNALKYTGEQPVIEVSLTEDDGLATITITDNGLGIAPEYREQVFEQFFRVPQGNLHDIKGFGLGLSYVRQVISQHSGRVNLDSHIGEGSTFTIQLPLAHG